MEGARVSGGSPGGERSEPEGEPLAPKLAPCGPANPERSGGEIETGSMRYSNGFRARMVQRLATPCGPSAGQLAQEVGVSQPTLSRWLREAGNLGESSLVSPSPSSRRGMNEKRPQDWSAEEKLQAVIEAATLSEEDLGAFLRRRGLHEAQLKQWRQLVLSGLKPQPVRSGKATTADARRVRELERELTRKEKALAEAAALLILKKKAQTIWGDADDSTDKKSGSRS